ncbi:glucuronyl hydrolase [Echinicola pacifica]|uniref:Glucuronyl hydrolase n=1 Tax=Echinicola pacifica TaxID=346377 RepID=A0A918UIY4_9BACT|nr:glycoside hydrolase family 88 protein [Echinicola pacifica]GGZ13599.1 glucuronyl hydrolase [Echinicola pacifica]
MKDNNDETILNMILENRKIALSLLSMIMMFGACEGPKQNNEQEELSQEEFKVDDQLDYCLAQAEKTLQMIPEDSVFPRTIKKGETAWRYVPVEDWTSGFWPGTLWYLYEYAQTEQWKEAADKYTRFLTPLSLQAPLDHDIGFQIFCSFGNGYRLTGNPEYKQVILDAADQLTTLYNPNVGTILSWPRDVPNMEWPQHNTIMDNMMNLELLMWSADNGGEERFDSIAIDHAETTMEHHFREDYSSYHVVVYDRESGEKIKGVTHQGYADSTMWARGQSWAIYGYTLVYRESKDAKFLDFAQKVTDVYLDQLPEDLIPYWDFSAPDIPDAPRDASAAAVTASALLELGPMVGGEKGAKYMELAEKMIVELSSERYQSRDQNSAFLLHSTGHHPGGSEIDASINYADYYYVEALIRLKKYKEAQAKKS